MKTLFRGLLTAVTLSTAVLFSGVRTVPETKIAWTGNIERKLFAQILDWKPAVVLHLGDMLGTGRGDGLGGRKGWFRTLTRNQVTENPAADSAEPGR